MELDPAFLPRPHLRLPRGSSPRRDETDGASETPGVKEAWVNSSPREPDHAGTGRW